MGDHAQQEHQEMAAAMELPRMAYMYQGLGCCFTGCDLNNIMHCLAANHDAFGIGVVTEEYECCKLGMFCCTVSACASRLKSCQTVSDCDIDEKRKPHPTETAW